MWISREKYELLKNNSDNHTLILDKANLEADEIRRNLQAEVDKLNDIVSKANKEIEELKSKVREQTSADLLVNGLKAVGIIPQETKKAPDYFAEQSRLNALRAYANSCGNYQNYFSGFGAFLGGFGNTLVR